MRFLNKYSFDFGLLVKKIVDKSMKSSPNGSDLIVPVKTACKRKETNQLQSK